jgi:ribosomal protein S18 acetylase RimI-like enzyme
LKDGKMKHWHGVSLGLVVAGTYAGLEFLELPEETKRRLVFVFTGVFMGAIAEAIWLLLMDLREATSAREDIQTTLQRLDGSINQIARHHDELVQQLSERIERDETISDLMDSHDVALTPESLQSKWMYLLCRLRKSYLATNYIAQIYDTDWAQAALHVQYAKRSDDLDIKKVFVLEKMDELLTFASHIERQRGIGVQIYFLLRSDVAHDAALEGRLHVKDIPSIDFGIFDTNRVLSWELDGSRRLTGGRVLFGRDHTERHERFFDDLFKKAKQVSKDHFVVVRIPEHQVKEIARLIDGWKDSGGKGYSGDYANMDYALRLGSGWLTKFGTLPGTVSYAAYHEGVLVGFSLLIGASRSDKEFYVAIRPGHLGSGLGKRLTKATVGNAFDDLGLDSVHLKVRPHPDYRVKMYQDVGFTRDPNLIREEVNGVVTEFFTMRMNRSDDRPMQSKGALDS